MWNEAGVRDHAGMNHGLIDHQTALHLGASKHYIKMSLRSKRWDEVHPGVYYLNVTPRTWHSDVLAAVLAAGPDAVASHRTAAVLWGLDGVRTRMIEITVPFNDEPEPSGASVHRTRRPVSSLRVSGIPVPYIERTLLDLARFLPDPPLERAVESAIRKKHTSVDAIVEGLRQQGGRGVTGTRRLRRVVQLVDRDITGSVAEVDARALIRDAPIPYPVIQLRVPLPNAENAYPDFAWPDRHKIVEIDGFEPHSDPDSQEHDLRRQNLLLQLGWQIRRFSARQVRREPQEVVAEIVRFVNG